MGNQLKIKINKKIYKGFSLVELLLALAIFGIVVTANFGLAIDAFRSRQNDRTRLEAGLVIKDTINSLYSIKSSSWSEMIRYFDQDPDGSDSRVVDVINNKIQINFGTKVNNGVTYQVYFKKADRDSGELVPASDGNDPDTIKVIVVASWTDIFNNTQQLTENYFLTNWSSTSWTEYDDYTFSNPPPVLTNTKVENDSVQITSSSSMANSDWCVITDNITTKSYDLFPVGSGSTQAIATNSAPSGAIDYEMYEPSLTGPIPTNAPAPASPVMPVINNSNPSICTGTGTTITQCESLLRLFDSTNGTSWTNNTGWKANANPCSGWNGVGCSGTNITSISLIGNNLTGTLPTELGNLTSLTTLNLSGNSITGPIPPQIGRLTSLTTLNLSSNQLDGVIPKTIGNNTALTTLNLSSNQLDGQIPPSIGRLTALNILYLNNNTLTCHIPTNIANLSNINGLPTPGLNLSNNRLLSPTSITLLSTYLSNKSAILTGQQSVINHEDCLYRPSSDNIYVAQHNTTEGEHSRALYLERFANGAFPPSMTESIIDTVGWDNNTSSGGLRFDGGDVVAVDYSSKWNVQNDMTIMTWFRSNDTSQDSFDRILDFSNGSTTGWFLSFTIPNKLRFTHFGLENLIIEDNNTISDSNWRHIAVVISGGTGTMYINGASPLTDTYTSLSPVTGTTQQLRFGNNTALTNGAVIDMDDVRIYNRALSQNEIVKSYQTEINRNDAGLIGYWRMNVVNSVDQTVYDFSYQGKHGWRGSTLAGGEASDPALIAGNAKYRVNDIYKYNNRLYMSTSNPTKDIVVFNLDTNTHNIINFGLASNDDTQGVVIANDTRGFAIQDSYVIQFNPATNTYVSAKNLTTIGGLKLRNIIDMKLNSNQLYLLGLGEDGNFGVMDVTNGITPTPRVNNLLLEAFL